MNKSKNGIAVSILVIGIVGGFWFLTHTKRHYARVISEAGNTGGFLTLLTFDKAYLKAWAKASVAKATTFDYNGKKYNTKGGKSAV